MTGIRTALGDAMIAAGERIRGDDAPAGVWPVEAAVSGRRVGGDQIPPGEVRAALAGLEDSELLNIAATIIDGWRPILLSAQVDALTDVDLLVAELRNRADEFADIERDADTPFPVDSATRLCCKGIGGHTQLCPNGDGGRPATP